MSTTTKPDRVAAITEWIRESHQDYRGAFFAKAAIEKRFALLNELEALVSDARSEGREFSEGENRVFCEGKRMVDLLSSLLAADGYVPPSGPSVGLQSVQGEHATPDAPQHLGFDSNGRAVLSLSNQQKFADLPSDPSRPSADGCSLGRLIVAKITGNWTHAHRERELLASLSTTSSADGGLLVPSELSRNLIDKARAASAVVSAGAVTIPMASDRLTMARVATDPSFTVVGENTAITESNPTFTGVGFTAHKIAGLVKMSRELVDDAANISSQIEAVLAKAFAAELDRLALVGSGSNEPTGLSLATGIGATTSVGAIAWADVHNAAAGVRALNHSPNAYVLHPTIAGDLDILTSGDGSSSAALWLGNPPSISNIERHVTTNATTALCFMGDWTYYAIAIRQDPLIEITTTGGDAFEKHQVLIKLTWRGDCNILDPSAFHLLSGITT